MIELLVVIAIIGVIAAMLLPALSAAKERAVRTKCLSNLKQINLGLIAYANDNRELLPRMQAGNWAWDLPRDVGDILMRNGITRDIMYDPANPDQNLEVLWNFAPPSHNQPLGYRVIGYAMTFPGTRSVIGSNQNETIVPKPRLFAQAMLPAKDTSRSVLMAGVVICASTRTPDIDRAADYNWTRVQGGAQKPHRTSHLDSKRKMPTGDNQAMLDGSGRWARFKTMEPRTEGAAPVFWW